VFSVDASVHYSGSHIESPADFPAGRSVATILLWLLASKMVVYLGEKSGGSRIQVVIDTILQLQEYISTLNRLQVDQTEYAYLKAIVLFSPGRPTLFLCH
jgi:hypothetical protein